jgi:hypothetical protein
MTRRVRAREKSASRGRHGFRRRSFGLRFGSSGLFERGEGLAPFLIADARAPFPSDPGGCGASSREKGTRRPRRKAPGHAEKTGRSIRRPACDTPTCQARSGVELKPSGRAPALHALEYLTTPAFKLIPSVRSYEANAAALVRRVTTPFIQRPIVHSIIPFLRKEIASIWLIWKAVRRRLSCRRSGIWQPPADAHRRRRSRFRPS